MVAMSFPFLAVAKVPTLPDPGIRFSAGHNFLSEPSENLAWIATKWPVKSEKGDIAHAAMA
jgi:hypothetical protein